MKEPASSFRQPWLVELAAILFEDDGVAISQVSLIVKPDGWTIPEAASRVHGITTERAQQVGLPLRTVMSVFTNMRANAQRAVAHNIDFDWLVMDAQLAKLSVANPSPWPALMSCTMKASAELVGLPPSAKMAKFGFTKNKPPSLNELHEYLFKKPVADAHRAMSDARACADCFWELKKRGVM